MPQLRKVSVFFTAVTLLVSISASSVAALAIPLFGWHLAFAGEHGHSPVVAIIIDDIGYAYTPGLHCIELPASITLSVIPFTPYGRRLAKEAFASGKEVMLHAPMETVNQRIWEPSLATGMDRAGMITRLGVMLQSIPHVRGLNNHGGSLLTQDEMRMGWLMSVLQESGLYFVDSRTTSASVGFAVAKQSGVPSTERDIFLDNNRSPAAIERQLSKLQEMAHTHGQALAIGHPYAETISALRTFIPLMEASGIRVVFVSEYLNAGEGERE